MLSMCVVQGSLTKLIALDHVLPCPQRHAVVADALVLESAIHVAPTTLATHGGHT